MEARGPYRTYRSGAAARPARMRGGTGPGDAGFTLFELLLSLTIMSVIVVIVFGALRVGIRAWEKGERDLDGRQRQRIVLDLVKRQLASTSAVDVWDGEQQLVRLRGDHKSLEFVSRVPLTPGNRFDLVYVRYAVRREQGVEGERLTFHERSVVLPERGTLAGSGAPRPDEFTELISGMKSIGFEYLKDRPDGAAARWEKSWDPAVDRGAPRAVRITLEENDERGAVAVVAGAGA